jgi:hypothetical protein
MTDDDYKYIYTKRRVYRLPKDARGIPIEEVYPGAAIPAFLKGAVVYDTPRGPIIAHQDSSERDGRADSKDADAARRQAIGKDVARTPPSAAAEPPESPAKLETPTPERQDGPMRFFRKDASARSAADDPWQAVKITCQETASMRSQKSGIEHPARAAADVRVMLARHFPEGPESAAQALKAATRWNGAADRALNEGTAPPERSDPARRWTAFCRDYTASLKQAAESGLAPAACNPYADIDFSAILRERGSRSKAPNRPRDNDRGGFER